MTISTSSRVITISADDMDSIQEANKAFEGGSDVAKEIKFIEDTDILKLIGVTTKLSELSLKDKILLANGWAKKLKGEYIYPHVTELADGDIVYQHCIYLSALRSFSPVLAMPHSGQGFSTVKEWGIKHPAVLSFDVTVGGLDITELDEDDEPTAKEMHAQKVATALGRITLKWCAPDSKEWKEYAVGACIPEGSAAYQVKFEDVKATGAPIRKEGFSFVVTRKPVVKTEDVTLIGNPQSCTQARVKIKVWGTWLGTSQAEKFASTLSKLCVDAMPEANSLEDTMAGGICLFDAPKGGSFTNWCQAAVKGEVAPLPLTDVGLGQETAKGAPTYNPASAVIKAVTGKHVKRQTHAMTQPVEIKGEIKQFPIGDVVWDSDEFVAFRNEWNKAALATGVWARWTDEIMMPILKKAVKYEETLAKAKALQAEGKKAEASALWEAYPYRFVATSEEGYYFFHKAEVRVELAPLTMETSTQKENLSAAGSGSMFWELINGVGQI